MDLTKKPISFFRLIPFSLQIAGKSFLSVVLLHIVLSIVFIILGVLTFFVLSNVRSIPASIAMALLFGVVITLLPVYMLQIISSKTEQTYLSYSQTLASSLWASVRFWGAGILLVLPYLFVSIGGAFTSSTGWKLAIMLCLSFGMLPFSFTAHAIVLRDLGPINALCYSWKLVINHYGRVLSYLIGFWMFCLFTLLAVIVLLKMLLPVQWLLFLLNPQAALMASSQHLSLSCVIGIPLLISGGMFLVNLYILTFVYAFVTILFINLDRVDRHLTDNPEFKLDPLDAETTTQAPVPNADIEVSVKQSSISTETDEHTSRHLDQVYRAEDHLTQADPQEEDRMPTILFDDDTARKLEETDRRIQYHEENKNQHPEDDGQQSIKISKKPL